MTACHYPCAKCGKIHHWQRSHHHNRQRYCSARCKTAVMAREAKAIDPNDTTSMTKTQNTADNASGIPLTGEIVDGAVSDMSDAVKDFGARFRGAWAGAVEGILRSGAILAEAKEALPHGAWERFVAEELPFGVRTARRLMHIARSPNMTPYVELLGQIDSPKRQIGPSGSDLAATLPPSWRTLYDLSVLPPKLFNDIVAAGAVHATSTRADIKTALAALDRPDTTSALAVAAAATGDHAGYGAILADPPWRFETRGRGGDRMADNHYPTMTFEDICALPVADLAAPDCALFLWITTEQLMRGQEVMAAWGFAYKTVGFVWRKTSGPMGLGYWTRKQTELCLLGTRGKPRRQGQDVEDIIEAPRGRHSAKPEDQYGRIERLVAGPYLELFARRARPGWDAWGNEPDAGSAPDGEQP